MDVYDYIILDIIAAFKKSERSNIHLNELENVFWKRIKNDGSLNVGKARLGERIARLYIEGFIEKKDGYQITKKGHKEIVVD